MNEDMNMIQAINLALDHAMAANPKVLALGEEVGDNEGGGIVGVTRGLSTKYGTNRVRSTPISEQAIIGAAIGAAMAGYRPIAEIMLMNFTTVAMDMIFNHAAKLRYMSGGQTNVPMVIRTSTGTGLGNGGQHSDYLEAWFAHSPGIKVVAPSTPADAYGLMLAAIDDDDPVLFIENIPILFPPGPMPEAGIKVPIGKANICREGSDVTVIAHSRMVMEALAAAEALAGEAISVEVIDLRSIAPWDREAVMASVGKTGRAIVVHEAVKAFGVGAEISAEISEQLFGQLKAPVGRLGAPYTPVPFSQPLEAAYAPNREDIITTAKNLMA
jgi:acetoin:2,6-dichlorophenolindophenol oxidoreductase subunit beta